MTAGKGMVVKRLVWTRAMAAAPLAEVAEEATARVYSVSSANGSAGRSTTTRSPSCQSNSTVAAPAASLRLMAASVATVSMGMLKVTVMGVVGVTRASSLVGSTVTTSGLTVVNCQVGGASMRPPVTSVRAGSTLTM